MFTKPIVAYFMIDVNQAIMLYTVNFYGDVCQVFFNKTEKISSLYIRYQAQEIRTALCQNLTGKRHQWNRILIPQGSSDV